MDIEMRDPCQDVMCASQLHFRAYKAVNGKGRNLETKISVEPRSSI